MDLGKKQNNEAPVDRKNVVYWTIFFLGILCLLPWDIVVTVSSFWQYKFRDVTSNSTDSTNQNETNGMPEVLTDLQKEFETYINMAAGAASAPIVVAHVFLGHYTSTINKSLFALTGVIIMFTSLAILGLANTDDWQNLYMAISLSHIVLINIFRSLFRASTSVNMGQFPVDYMASVDNGLGMAGLVAVLLNISILMCNVNIQITGAVCFFSVATLGFIAFLLFLNMEGSDFYQHYTYKLATLSMPITKEGVKSKHNPSFTRSLLEVLQSCWLYMLGNFLNFALTNSIYPALTSLVQPVNYDGSSDWDRVFYVQVACFLNFNICNTLGTVLAGVLKWPGDSSTKSQFVLLGIIVARFGLLPFILFANVAPLNRTTQILFHSDATFIVAFSLLAFTDGYILNNVMMYGPKVGRPENQKLTASVLVAAQPVTVMLASIIANVLVRNI